MIIDLIAKWEDPYTLDYYFVNQETGEQIATSHNTGNIREYHLNYKNNDYCISTMLKRIKKCKVEFKYPTLHNWKFYFGFKISKNGKHLYNYYVDAMRVRNKGPKKNIECKVFGNEEKHYVMFTVGFRKEPQHYYCLYEGDRTVAIVERIQLDKNDCKAHLYIQDEKYLEIGLLLMAEEVMAQPVNAQNDDVRKDYSAGNYISIMKEEQELFDRISITQSNYNL